MNDEEFDYTKRKRKNTKRWCKGKLGREHDVRHLEDSRKRSYIEGEDKCILCGKVFKLHFRILWSSSWDNSCSTLVESDD